MPDSIPVVDELIMVFGILKKINSMIGLVEWIEDHKVATCLIGILVIGIIVALFFIL